MTSNGFEIEYKIWLTFPSHSTIYCDTNMNIIIIIYKGWRYLLSFLPFIINLFTFAVASCVNTLFLFEKYAQYIPDNSSQGVGEFDIMENYVRGLLGVLKIVYP